jgi:hypothetical protein
MKPRLRIDFLDRGFFASSRGIHLQQMPSGMMESNPLDAAAPHGGAMLDTRCISILGMNCAARKAAQFGKVLD